MQLSDEIIDAFVKTLPNGEKDNSNGYELYYGTVKVSNGKTSVILDGSPVETPLNYLTMGAENGDRVTCIIKDHSLIVTGNLTHPSEGMTTKYIETMTVLAQEAAIGKLIATEGDFTELTADSAFVKRLMSDQVGASILTADEAFVGSLQSQIVTADKIKAMQAEIGYVDAETLEADYLQADMANLKVVEATKASIANLLADMALIKNATISQGHITGALDSVTLNANYITAGSLSVDRLYINGDDGKPRLVEFNEDGEPVATTIDASILTDRTITADKLVANSITANEISTDFITAFKANIMQTVTEDLHSVTAEIEKLVSGDTELDSLKLKEPLAEQYGGTGVNDFNDLFKTFRDRDYRLNYTRTNLLNPTAQTQTINGVTFTNNGDGTYTVNGTASPRDAQLMFKSINSGFAALENTKLVGCPARGASTPYRMHVTCYNGSTWLEEYVDYGNGVIISDIPSEATSIEFSIFIKHGAICNNLLYKPMLTTDTNATYDDFVRYSGDGELNENVADIYGDVTALKINKQDKTDESLTTTSKEIVGAINEHESDILQINAEVSELKATSQVKPEVKKWFLFGDSISAIESGYTSILKGKFGDRFNFKAQGSMKYSTNNVSGYYIFTDKLDEWLPTISNKDSYTDVIIELGSNDTVAYSSSHLTTGFNSAINKVKSNFPNAIIHVAIVGKSMNESVYSTRKSVINQLKQLAGSSGCTWITNNDNILGAKYQTFDRIHPTENGHNIIANSLMSYMMGGDCTPCTLPVNTQTGNLQGLEIKEEYDNGKYHFSIHGTINNSNGIHIPSALGITGIKIGTVNLNYCYRDIVVSGFIQAELTVFGTTVRHSIPCTISVAPRNDNSTTCDVLLAASYIDYYRDSNGSTKVWSDGFTFTSGIVLCGDVTVPA